MGVSRRSVALGAAWTLPALVVAAAAPLAAASGEPGPALTAAYCKVSGANNTWTYDLTFTFTSSSADVWFIDFTSFTFDGTPVAASDFYFNQSPNMGPSVTKLYTVISSSSGAFRDVRFSYTATNQRTGESFTVSYPPTAGDLTKFNNC